jgi:hypothetical protein
MGALHRACCFARRGSTTACLADVADRLHPSSTTTCDTVAHDSTSLPDHGRTCDTAGEPSPDGHTGQRQFSATSRPAHSHHHSFLVTAFRHSDLCSRRPCRSKLYRGRVWDTDEQWDMGTCSPAPWLQRRHQQVGLHTQVPLRWDFRPLQGSLGSSGLHSAP